MTEWVLIIVLNIAGQPGEIRDPSISLLGGFTSLTRCEAAGQKIAERSIGVVGRARIQQGIQGNTFKSIPAINTECVQVVK